MKLYQAWDIETCPTPEALLESYPEEKRSPPSNYSKPETIAKWKADDRVSWETDRIKEYSLSPRTGRIVAFSACDGKGGIDVTALDVSEERALIEQAFEVLFDPKVEVIVGFNSRAFDFPFLCLRAMYHRIDPMEYTNAFRWKEALTRYSKYNTDVREMLTFGAYGAKGTLSEWGAWAGDASKETAGSQVWEWVQAGDAMAISRHCYGDAKRTAALFERVYPLYQGA